MILTTRGLTKAYAGVKANTDVDFDLPAGQTRAIIGPNGAGKSTFVGMICGRIPATRGTVTFDGQDVTTLPAHKRIERGMAYTFQITSVFPGLPVRENVALAARRGLGRNKAAVRNKTDEVLSRLNISDRADQMAGDLSYGHQRILEIGMGLAQEPRLFILDEPTQGLAESEVEDFNTLIKTLDAETTILLIEHNMNVVMEVAEYITVLDQGMVLANGTPQEIRANAAVQEAYLGSGHA
ncbi:ABC transporter ATP-binding protein [Neptunicoccus cionae]|uniref:ABC transporter ATP-binding protein n=1 Tax=Neptunicoccus cionae TaxID=2035344 RepID=UPI000C765A31|nr:ABC transporter ATP-binding protein [Amylibacter cionae]PLS23561.1 ABC transporter ATP-binding protein [Amylibacter cionae]